MDKQAAVKIIRDTFEGPFDKGQYVCFIKDLFNRIDEDTFECHGQYIKDSYKPYIKKYERIGKYSDSEGNKIDILIVNLKKETLLERARTMQRNFIAQYLKDRGEKDAAIVAFHTDDLEDWRFSFVKMEYKLAQTKSGRVKAKEELTPARRYSFLVGKNEPNHTAQEQLVPLLQDDVNNPNLAHLESAFNIEKVTKEFFEKYRELYHQLEEAVDKIAKIDKNVKEEFTKKNVDTVDFSKKLLGQIVFLCFLQKKGWLGVPSNKSWSEGDKGFLRTLFNECAIKNKNFFNDYLEVLFYNTLNNPRQNEVDPSYSRHFDCRIPFLNGGLFEPIQDYDWAQTDIKIPDKLFSNDKKTKEGDIGTGILDVFDRYNFTVKEDEPLDKEVAIDPEMLGKVFENLLEVKDRKSKGSYYTPREIVHYMCQESLINYLATELTPSSFVGEGQGERDVIASEAKQSQLPKKEDIETLIHLGEFAVEHDTAKEEGTKSYKHKIPESIRENAKTIDEKLENIRICDPAVGSGAFLVGMMTEIVKARNVLNVYICHSRESGNPENKPRTIYNFKRHAIQNCLYGVDIDPSAVDIAKLRLWLSLVVDEGDIRQIKPLPNLDYKIICGNSLLGIEKDNLFTYKQFARLEELKPLLFNETNSSRKQEYKRQIDKLIKEITNNNEHFDFEVYFSEVFHERLSSRKRGKGFDVVIANPPYGADYSANEKKHFQKQYLSTKTITGVQKGSLDTFTIFIELGYNVLKKYGNLNYIVPIAITSSDSMTALHKLLEDNCDTIKVSSYSVRPQPVFENAVVNTSILFFTKTNTKCRHIYSTKMYRKNKDFNLQKLVNNLQFIDVADVKLQGRYPKISYPIEKEILKKIFNQDKSIGDLLKAKGKEICYRFAGGRYYKVVTNYSTGSSAERVILFEEKIANVIGAILSSNLFFWFYQIYSDNLNLKSYEIESFTIPYSKLSDKVIEKIEQIYNEYLKDIESNAKVRQTTRYANIDSFKEYKIGKSKALIDRIDDIIGPLYGLSKEEIEFIKNYEIEFRLGEDTD